MDIPTHWPLHDIFNVDHFKRNDVDNSRPILPPPPLRTTKGGKVEFEVDKIIDEKKDEHGMQLYYVLWFGGDTTWEPELHMKQGAKEAVKEFWKAGGIEPPSWTHPKPRKRKTVLPALRASARIPRDSQKLREQAQGLAYS